VLAQAIGLRAAGLTFAAIVAALAATVIVWLAGAHRPSDGVGSGVRQRAVVHAGSTT